MTNPLRLARAAKSALLLMRNPSRLDQVFELADSTVSPKIMASVVEALAQDPMGAQALEERPRLGRIDLAALRALPRGTLGRNFAEHMVENDLDPSALPNKKSPDAASYVRAHLYETHDVWHVVTGFSTSVAGELGLQAFYLAQFPARLSAALVAGGILNALFFDFSDRDARMRSIVRGWLLGKRARPIFGVPWAELWATPLEEVRRRFGLDLVGVEQALAA